MSKNDIDKAFAPKIGYTSVIRANFLGKYFHQERYVSSDFEVQPDFAKMAQASKCHGDRVERADEVGEALNRALRSNREGVPAVVDFIIDGDRYPPGFSEYYGIGKG